MVLYLLFWSPFALTRNEKVLFFLLFCSFFAEYEIILLPLATSFKYTYVQMCVLMAQLCKRSIWYYPSLKSGQFQSSRVIGNMLMLGIIILNNISPAWAVVFIWWLAVQSHSEINSAVPCFLTINRWPLGISWQYYITNLIKQIYENIKIYWSCTSYSAFEC